MGNCIALRKFYDVVKKSNTWTEDAEGKTKPNT